MRVPEYEHFAQDAEVNAVKELQRLATELNKVWDTAGILVINSITQQHN